MEQHCFEGNVLTLKKDMCKIRIKNGINLALMLIFLNDRRGNLRVRQILPVGSRWKFKEEENKLFTPGEDPHHYHKVALV